jgi:Asp-tRNA(Asn)/Glu-tRNA(Gln) amidotransferase A subunit family amidase
MKATALPIEASWVESFPRNLEMTPNTAAFNVTGHPALSIRVRFRRPSGMMLVGRS